MIYLTTEDLIANSFETFINESSKDHSDVLEIQEKRAIDYVRSMLSSRYNTRLIFEVPIRNEVLISIISTIVIYKTIRRNAARKVPTDYAEEYERAIAQLEKIANGRMRLHDLPTPLDELGNPDDLLMWGNNRNEDFYL